MHVNLWNTQSPTKRIDLYFKIDDYRKHLLSLKNVKSTFGFKQTTSSLFHKHHDLNRSVISIKKPIKPLAELTCIKQNQPSVDRKKSKNSTCRQNTDPAYNSRIIDCNSSLNYGKINSSTISSSGSPKKFVNFREWQINQDNKKILKKLQEVKASPELSKKKLFHQYSMSDLKYKMNLQKTRYKNVDFTKAAQKLLKGQKIKFSKIRMGIMETEDGKDTRKQKIKISEINLKWQLSRTNITNNQGENIKAAKDLR